MKTRLSVLVLSAALAVSGVRLFAQSQPPAMVDSNGIRQMSIDLNVNALTEQSERDAAAQALRVRLSAATYDLNHDGKLDEKEFAAWEKEVRAVMSTKPAMLKKYDKNHDGKIDDSEWAAARKDLLGS